MKIRKKVKNKGIGFLAAVLFVFAGVWTTAFPVQAASGNVYTCTVHPCYAHPVTGEIEDSGGEASYATGQGMVDGVVYTTGILELTDSGEYYLTVRFSLMDQTSGHSFWVQNVGDSGWATPAVGVTGNGTDDNGTTADICIQVPGENCVVRCSMYVAPMGRDVVFYLYPSDYAAGNNTNMNATMVRRNSDNGQLRQCRHGKWIRRNRKCGYRKHRGRFQSVRFLTFRQFRFDVLRKYGHRIRRRKYGDTGTVQFHR